MYHVTVFIARESSIIYLFQSCLLISNITPKSFLGFVHKGIERISGMIRAAPFLLPRIKKRKKFVEAV